MYYLIEHNRTTKKTNWKEYEDYAEVRAVALAQEQEYFKKQQNEIEVVIFEADSIDSLKRTHSRYFVDKDKSRKLAEKDGSIFPTLIGGGVAVGLVGLAIYLLSKKND